MPECPGALQFSDMHDGPMIRLRFPAGIVTGQQLRALHSLSADAGNGLIDLTNRANLQIRGLTEISDPKIEAILHNNNLLPQQLWADRLRNIMADPVNPADNGGLIKNISPLLAIKHPAKELDSRLQQTPSLKDLPAKFCFIIDNGSCLKISNQPHDIALRAYQDTEEIRFGLLIANHRVPLSVSKQQVAQFMIEIADFICHFGQSINRGHQILNHLGLAALTKAIKDLAPYCTAQQQLSDSQPQATPPIGIFHERSAETITLGLGVPVARLTAEQLYCLMDLSRAALSAIPKQHGHDFIKLSPWQIIYVPDIPKRYANESLKIAQDSGFITDPSFLTTQVYACSGATGCPRTKANSKEEGLELTQHLALASNKQKAFTHKPIKIHLSGCDRGCAFAGEADILALAQTDGSGYTLYNNKSLADIRAQTHPDNPALHSNIVQTVMERVNDHLEAK